MRKIRNLMLMAGIISAVAIVVLIQKDRLEQKAVNELLSLNVESLTSSEAPGTGGGVFLGIRVCAKKEGDKFCSNKRGNRKWAFNIGTTFGATYGYADCTEEYDEGYDGYGEPNYKP